MRAGDFASPFWFPLRLQLGIIGGQFMELFTLENLIALLTLTILEIVLGIDNIVFISILSDKLPAKDQAKGRQLGLAIALITRILLLLSLSWIIKLEEPLFHILELGISGRDLILLIGGIFLIAKSTMEIHDKLEGKEHGEHAGAGKATLAGTIVQIGLLDIVFSIDSVITAVGMAKEIIVMVLAVVIAVAIMLLSSGAISDFVNKHPTVKVLALSFLLLIGTSLLVEGLHQEIPKGYIYFAMAFSVFVELVNMKIREGSPVHLKHKFEEENKA